MATRSMEDLLIGATVDPRGITEGMAEGLRAVQQAAQEMERVAAATRLTLPDIDLRSFRAHAESAESHMATAGADAGRAYAASIQQELRQASAVLGEMAADMTTGGGVEAADVAALRELVVEQRDLAKAVAGAEIETQQLAEALAALDGTSKRGIQGLKGVQSALSDLRRAQIEWQRSDRGSVEAQAAYARERMQLQQAAVAQREKATAAERAAQAEIAARTQVRAELQHEIRLLRLAGQAVDARNTRAIVGWRQEAAAIRQQAVEVNLGREGLLRLDAVIRQTENSFRRQAAAARLAAHEARGISRSTAIAVGGLGALTRANGDFSQLGQRAANTAVAVGFGLEAIARGGYEAETGVRTALRAISGLGSFFGPKGMIVSGAALATTAMIDLFSRARDEAVETRRTFDEELTRLINATDRAAIELQRKELFRGTRASGEGTLTDNFADGLGELRAQLAQAEANVVRFERALNLPGALKAAAQAKQLREQLAPLEQQYRDLTRAVESVPATLPTVTITAPSNERLARETLQELQQAASRTVLRLNVATELGAGPEEIRQLMGDVIAQERTITEEIRRRGGVRRAELELLQEQVRLQEALRLPTVVGEIRMPKLPELRTVDLTPLDEVRRMARAVAEARAQVELMELSPNVDTTAFQAARERLEEVEAAALTTRAAVVDFLLGLDLPPDVLTGHLAALTEAFSQTGIEASRASKEARALLKTVQTITTGARGALQIADAFGDVDASVRRTADGFISLTENALKAYQILDQSKELSSLTDLLKSPEGFASVIGMIGGAASLLAGLSQGGPSTGEQLLSENNKRLLELRLSLEETRASLANLTGGIRGSEAIMAAIARDPFALLPGGRGDPRTTGLSRQAVDEVLRPLGTSFAQLQHHAEQLGISLVDTRGRINPYAFEQVAEALESARRRALEFGQSFSELTRQASAEAQLFSLESAADQWAQAADIIGDLRMPDIARQMEAFNIDTAAGRQAAQQFLQNLYRQAEANLLDEQLFASGFESVQEFIDWILLANDPLRELGDAAAEVAGTMRNIPPGYKLDRQRWASIMAEIPNLAGLNRAPEARVPTAEPVPPALTSGGRTGASAGQTVIVQQENHWHIDRIDAQDRPLREVYRELKELAQQDAYNHFGDPSRVAEVLAYN